MELAALGIIECAGYICPPELPLKGAPCLVHPTTTYNYQLRFCSSPLRDGKL